MQASVMWRHDNVLLAQYGAYGTQMIVALLHLLLTVQQHEPICFKCFILQTQHHLSRQGYLPVMAMHDATTANRDSIIAKASAGEHTHPEGLGQHTYKLAVLDQLQLCKTNEGLPQLCSGRLTMCKQNMQYVPTSASIGPTRSS